MLTTYLGMIFQAGLWGAWICLTLFVSESSQSQGSLNEQDVIQKIYPNFMNIQGIKNK